jgi:signal transduction histidine kinase
MSREARALTLRYVGALLVVSALLVVAQLVIQRALERTQCDARLVNLAGRQRMLSQRLCMWLATDRLDELPAVADEWSASQRMLRRVESPPEVHALYDRVDGDQRAMLADASAAFTTPDRSPLVRDALAHQDRFLDGMDRIVALYEVDASGRVLRLRWIELALLALVLAVLALEGLFVFRPAVRALRGYLAEREGAARAVADAAEHERRRIASDLHDGLGQHLVGVALVVRSLPASSVRDDLDRLLRDAIEQTRGIARGLHSATLEAEGLAAALHELAVQTEQVAKLTCRTVFDAPEPPATVGVHLHRIAGEAVLNAIKHARATTIEITARGDDSYLELEIRDDGVGLGAQPGNGLGLELMANRARVLGATLHVGRAEPTGTIVCCRITLKATS